MNKERADKSPMARRDTDPVQRIALEVTRRFERTACFEALCEGALEVLGGRWALAYLSSDSGDDLDLIVGRGEEGMEALAKAIEVLDAGLVFHLAPEGASVLEEASALLPAGVGIAHPPVGSALLLPLSSSGGRVGCLLLFGGRGEPWAAETLARADRLGAECSAAMDNLRSIEALRELVIRDDTADCYNRRHLDASLEDEVERARRFGSMLSVIFLDLDNLKSVNTRFGHSSGSRVLHEASVRIGRTVRSIDRLFRYGGDEFVVLLPGTGLDGAREVAERIRREVADTPFHLSGDEKVELTISTGVSCWPFHGQSGRKVLEVADRVMREVKATGKNRVAVARCEREE